jgi:CRISPR-associated protein Csx3
MNLFPAVLIGGPPHRGKSILTYSLSRALRQRGIQHYVLRAAPDGEGDWANEADQEIVRTIRIKGRFSPDYVQHIRQSVSRRHLPLLVDAGGRPSLDQEAILDECTHAVVLYGDDAELEHWLSICARRNLIVVAALRSELGAPGEILDQGAVLRGIVGGLERGHVATGVLLEALTQRIAGLFNYSSDEILGIHLSAAPTTNTYVVERLARLLHVSAEGERFAWQPQHLPPLLDALPAREPLALYGRGPNWLYAATVAQAIPAPFWQFDVRLGWAQTPEITPGTPSAAMPLITELSDAGTHAMLELSIPAAYLDYDDTASLRIPEIPGTPGLIISGKLPNWLWTSLVRAYQNAEWIGVYQPMLKGAVVVARTVDTAPAIGSVIEVSRGKQYR